MTVIRHLRRVALGQDGGGLTDGQLLECYLAQREEGAFAALVRRHGPMVLSVCRRVLHNVHDAEDAFQATFLILVRKADSVVPRQLVGNWLYGVAYRTALKARTMNARRRAREERVRDMPRPEVFGEDGGWRELQPLLDRELSRLPEKHRALVVLCDLEGKTRKEAARLLDLSEGTVSSRLARARAALARRLARHRVALSAGALAALLTRQAAAVPAPLVMSTVKAATRLAAGEAAAGVISAQVAALAEGVIKAMWITKLKIATALLLAAAVVGWGVGLLTQPALADKPAKVKKEGDRGKGDTGKGKKTAQKADPSIVHGVVKAVDTAQNTITIHLLDKKQKVAKTFALAKEVQIFLEEGRKGQQGKLTDLAEGTGVTLKLSEDGKTVTAIAGRGPNVQGAVKAVDAGRHTITVAGKFGEKTYALGKDVRISRPSGKKGEQGQLADLVEGAPVSLQLSVNRQTVLAIAIHHPTLFAMVQAVDAGKNTVTILTKSKEGAEEKTLPLGKEARIVLPDPKGGEGRLKDLAKGTSVTLNLSLDRQTIVAIFVHHPSLFGAVKAVDAGKNTLTVTTKESGGLVTKTLTLAKGARIVLADPGDEKEGKLADLAEGTSVNVRLSLDRKTALEVTVYGPSFIGTLKGVDAGSNTITVTVKESGTLVDKTFDVAKSAFINVSDGKSEQKAKLTDLTVGAQVAIRLSVDKTRAVAIQARKSE
jgi:RNA polymerase sigma factor (sigma-70 family)